MMKKKRLLVGNWKMNPTSLEEAKRIIRATRKVADTLKRTEVVICPPHPFMSLVKPKGRIYLGMQDSFYQAAGSFTGEVSTEMGRSFGATYTIVGHSERRAMGEGDELVGKKAAASLIAGNMTIVCIGEKERDQSGSYLGFLRTQICSSLQGVRKKFIDQLIIAYEPVFAIGKSFAEAMQPSDILETTLFIKKALSENFGKDWVNAVRILYGGSVNFEIAPAIIEGGGVSGLLIGRESLNIETFSKLLKVVDGVPI